MTKLTVIGTKELREAIITASKLAPKKSLRHEVMCVYLKFEPNKTTVAATDTVSRRRFTIPMPNEGILKEVLIPAGLLASSIGSFEDYQIALKLDSIVLFDDKRRVELMTMRAGDFPIQDVILDNIVDIDADMLRNTLIKGRISANKGEGNPVHSGVCLRMGGGFVCVESTDSRRATKCGFAFDSELEGTAILPPSTVDCMIDLLSSHKSALIGLDSQKIILCAGSEMLESSLISGKFPNVERVIPKDFTKSLKIDAKELLRELKTIMPLLVVDEYRVTLEMNGGGCSISAKDNTGNSCKINLQAEFDGDAEGFTFHLNANYLADAIKHVEQDALLFFTEDKYPVRISSPTGECNTALMPMSIG